MTTARYRRDTTTTGAVIPADRPPKIGELIPGSVIYRFAKQRTTLLVSDLPCHRDQMASVQYDPRAQLVQTDQPIVCRRCFTSYTATPVPPAFEGEQPKIAYLYTGHVTLSRPRRERE